jgi:hypothetical protein
MNVVLGGASEEDIKAKEVESLMAEEEYNPWKECKRKTLLASGQTWPRCISLEDEYVM